MIDVSSLSLQSPAGMARLPRLLGSFAACAFLFTVSDTAWAVDYSNATTNQRWGDSGNWNAAFPNSAGTTARIPTTSNSANQKVNLADSTGLDASFTVGSFVFGTGGGAAAQTYQVNNIAGGTGRVIFDVASGNATLTYTNIFADATMQFNTGITLNDTLSITGTRSNANQVINGQISSGVAGTGIIVNGPVRIGGANNYTGSTVISAGGNLRLVTGNDRLPTSGALVVNGGASAGTFDLRGFNQTVGSLTGGSGTVKGTVTNGAASGTNTLTVSSTTTNSVFDGAVQDGATASTALKKAGIGTSLTLTGAQTYTGATTVDGGALLVNGSLASGSAVSVNNSGILGGSGTVGGAVTVNTGGAIAAGNSIGTLATGTLDLLNGGTLNLEINTTAQTTDLLNVTGNISISNGASITIADVGSNQPLSLGTTFTFLDYSGIWNGGELTLSSNLLSDDEIFTFGANDYRISYNGTDNLTSAITLEVVPVPEPSVVSLLFAVCLIIGLRRRPAQLEI